MNLTYLEIDHQRSTYHNLSASPSSDFVTKLVDSWLYHDHALEGVVLSQEDLERGKAGLPSRNYCDARVQRSLRAMREAITFIHESAAAGNALSIDWLRELHTMLCPPGDEAAGRYRKRNTSPGVYHLEVAPANSISYYLHKFIDIYESELVDLHPIRRAAMAHHEFMKVFPFDERTGVVGRLMMNFLLIEKKFPPAIIHASNRHLYFTALGEHRAAMIPVAADAIRATIHAAHSYQARLRNTEYAAAAY